MTNFSKRKVYLFGGILVIIILISTVFFIWKQSFPAPTQYPITQSTVNEVISHNKPTDCQVVVGGNVYDLTSWISQHPGGKETIIGLCGTDGTAAFAAQHGSNREAQKALASYKIGVIKK
jgi:cytochrome b involved in lipid metabolism